MPTIALIPSAVVAQYVLSGIAGSLYSLIAPNLARAPLGGPDLPLHGVQFVAALVLACVIAPLGETLVFQWALIGGLRRFLRCGARWAVVVSALVFGLAHAHYSAQYAVRTAACGLVLGAVFVIERNRRGAAYWITATVHALYNLIGLFALSQLV
jgi:uncharacterized protein